MKYSSSTPFKNLTTNNVVLVKHNLVPKALNFFRWQDVTQFKSGAYALVREHFELNRNAVIGQKMMF